MKFSSLHARSSMFRLHSVVSIAMKPGPYTHFSTSLGDMLSSYRLLSTCRLILMTTVMQVFSIAFSLQINRTIDDTYGDSVTGLQVVYSEVWNIGQLCPGCGVQPNASEVFDGTWHDTTTSISNTANNATITFIGVYPSHLPQYQHPDHATWL